MSSAAATASSARCSSGLRAPRLDVAFGDPILGEPDLVVADDVLGLALAACSDSQPAASTHDVILRGGTVYDGSGDPATVADHATYEEPHQLATGVRDVFVNGVAVLRGGEHTGAKPGRVVRGPGWRQQPAHANR